MDRRDQRRTVRGRRQLEDRHAAAVLAGSRPGQRRPAWRDRYAGERYVAREHAPVDLRVTMSLPGAPEPADVLVGVELDPVEILLAGRDCVDCGYGLRREHAQDYHHPRTPTAPGEPRWPACTSGSSTIGNRDQPGGSATSSHRPAQPAVRRPESAVGPVFDQYLHRWAERHHGADQSWSVDYPDFFRPSGQPPAGPTRLTVPPAVTRVVVDIEFPNGRLHPEHFYTEAIPET
jgi:hypothetical protein